MKWSKRNTVLVAACLACTVVLLGAIVFAAYRGNNPRLNEDESQSQSDDSILELSLDEVSSNDELKSALISIVHTAVSAACQAEKIQPPSDPPALSSSPENTQTSEESGGSVDTNYAVLIFNDVVLEPGTGQDFALRMREFLQVLGSAVRLQSNQPQRIYLDDFEVGWQQAFRLGFNYSREPVLIPAVLIRNIRISKPESPEEICDSLRSCGAISRLAGSGNPLGCGLLGVWYMADRSDSPRDLVNAYYWLDKAASSKDPSNQYFADAQKKVASQMTDKELHDAKLLAGVD